MSSMTLVCDRSQNQIKSINDSRDQRSTTERRGYTVLQSSASEGNDQEYFSPI